MAAARAFTVAAASVVAAGLVCAGTTEGTFGVNILLSTGAPALPPVDPGPPVTTGPGGAVPGRPVTPPPGGGGGALPALPPPGATPSSPAPSLPEMPEVVSPSSPPPGPVPAVGICTSQALSVATGALVRVACSSSQFVGIEPAPGQPFVGVHGGAYRYSLRQAPLAAGAQRGMGTSGAARRQDAGSVTVLSVSTPTADAGTLRGDAPERPLQMLVTF